MLSDSESSRVFSASRSHSHSELLLFSSAKIRPAEGFTRIDDPPGDKRMTAKNIFL